MNKILLITFIFLLHKVLFAEETAKEKKIAKYIMENIQKDYLDCYSFYKVAAVSFYAEQAVKKNLIVFCFRFRINKTSFKSVTIHL